MLAEQNMDIIEEMETFKKDTKGAFEQLADIFETGMKTIKDDFENKCKTLADTFIKLYKKSERLPATNVTNKSKSIHKPNLKSKEEEKKKTNQKEESPKVSSYASVAAGSSAAKPTISKPSPPKSNHPSRPSPPMQPGKANSKNKTVFNSKLKILYAADSVGHTMDARKLEYITNSRIKTVYAYSSVYDKKARWPERNFTDVVQNAFRKPGVDNFDALVMSAPTVDISNLNTANLSTFDNTEHFQQQVIVSAQNMFNLAKVTLEQNQSLSKVVIMEHPKRFDTQNVDPTSLKSNLVGVFNETLYQLWLKSPLKNEILVGHHTLGSSGHGPSHLARYQNENTGRYDGVHMYGINGCKDYTRSVQNILLLAFPKPNSNQIKHGCGNAQPDSHCPQMKSQKNTDYHSSVQPQNRFDVFNTHMGNC